MHPPCALLLPPFLPRGGRCWVDTPQPRKRTALLTPPPSIRARALQHMKQVQRRKRIALLHANAAKSALHQTDSKMAWNALQR